MPLFLTLNHTNNAHHVSRQHNSSGMFSPEKPYNLAGFEPVLQADAMTAASRRLGLF
jgi:hypothetical protein